MPQVELARGGEELGRRAAGRPPWPVAPWAPAAATVPRAAMPTIVAAGRRRRPEAGGVAEGEHLARRRHLPVAAAGLRRHDGDDAPARLRRGDPVPGGAEEAGVTEGEHAAVGGRHPVAPPARGGGHAGDRPDQLEVAGRAGEGRVAEGEDAAVGRHQPVALAGLRVGAIPTIGLLSCDRPGRAAEGGVAEGEDAAVGGHQPVAVAARRRRHADDRLVELHGAGRAPEGGVAEGEDAAVGGDQPVALAAGRGRHADHRLVELHGPGRSLEGGGSRRRRRRRRCRRSSSRPGPAGGGRRGRSRRGRGAGAACGGDLGDRDAGAGLRFFEAAVRGCWAEATSNAHGQERQRPDPLVVTAPPVLNITNSPLRYETRALRADRPVSPEFTAIPSESLPPRTVFAEESQ